MISLRAERDPSGHGLRRGPRRTIRAVHRSDGEVAAAERRAMAFRVVHGHGDGSGREPRTGLHIVLLPAPASADRGGAGRHRLTTFAVTVDDLIERECASAVGGAPLWVLALAARRGLPIGPA